MSYPSAVPHPGPANKVWPDVNALAGVVLHSSEGYEAGIFQQLDGPAQVSWHYTVMKDGRVFEHYPLTASPWHAGSHAQNARLIGVEHEGVAGEPLTAAQLTASVALTHWIAAQCGFPMTRHDHLLEHNEIFATACPSGRIPWEFYMPDSNHADNYDIGLERLQLEAMLRVIRDEHGRAGGDKQVLKDIIDGAR